MTYRVAPCLDNFLCGDSILQTAEQEFPNSTPNILKMISHGRNSNKLLQDVSSVRTGALGMPGRNVCNFLQFYNFAMWIVVTFQLQNINSGFVEFEGGAEEDLFNYKYRVTILLVQNLTLTLI